MTIKINKHKRILIWQELDKNLNPKQYNYEQTKSDIFHDIVENLDNSQYVLVSIGFRIKPF